MKKYEQFTKEEIEKFCEISKSYRELSIRLGYAPDGGSGISQIKEMIQVYHLNIDHFEGQGHTKNLGKIRTPIEKYLNNEQKVTSFKLRNRLLMEGYFEAKCCCCGLTEWMDNPIPLELHHKDGNKNNNNITNLELRCPNCHYFTDTYKSKNVKKEHQDEKSLE